MGRQVKSDCLHLPVPLSYSGNPIYHCGSVVGPRQTVERDIAGGLEKFSAGVNGLMKKKLDCMVVGYWIFSKHGTTCI